VKTRCGVVGKRERTVLLAAVAGVRTEEGDIELETFWSIAFWGFDTERVTSGTREEVWQSALLALEISRSVSFRPGIVAVCKSAASSSTC
jgi:hypothetical protein